MVCTNVNEDAEVSMAKSCGDKGPLTAVATYLAADRSMPVDLDTHARDGAADAAVGIKKEVQQCEVWVRAELHSFMTNSFIESDESNELLGRML